MQHLALTLNPPACVRGNARGKSRKTSACKDCAISHAFVAKLAWVFFCLNVELDYSGMKKRKENEMHLVAKQIAIPVPFLD